MDDLKNITPQNDPILFFVYHIPVAVSILLWTNLEKEANIDSFILLSPMLLTLYFYKELLKLHKRIRIEQFKTQQEINYENLIDDIQTTTKNLYKIADAAIYTPLICALLYFFYKMGTNNPL